MLLEKWQFLLNKGHRRLKNWRNCRLFEGFDTEDFAVVDDIVSLGKNKGLEINNEDVE
jgi:hypothetical protein